MSFATNLALAACQSVSGEAETSALADKLRELADWLDAGAFEATTGSQAATAGASTRRGGRPILRIPFENKVTRS